MCLLRQLQRKDCDRKLLGVCVCVGGVGGGGGGGGRGQRQTDRPTDRGGAVFE